MSYEDGLVHRVRVFAKVAPAKDERGGDATPDVPVAGLESLAARVTTPTGRELADFATRGVSLTHKVLLPGGTRLSNRNVLLFLDPADGTPRKLQVHAAYDSHNLGRWYAALCVERTN